MVARKSATSVDIVVTPTDDHRSYHVSSEKIHRELGFSAQTHRVGRHRGPARRLRCRQGAECDDRRPLLQHQADAGGEVAMNSDTAPSDGPGAFETRAAGPVESVRAPKAIRLLLPVWDEHFIVQFLRISLPTLLSPGNLPAAGRPSTLQIRIPDQADGATLLKDHAAIRLSADCLRRRVRFDRRSYHRG